MIVELLIFFATIVVPFPIGYVLGHKCPERKPWKNALIAALPVSSLFFGYAVWITLTQDLSCEPEPCENMAPVWAMALYVLGIVTFVTGMGVGLLGDAYARKRQE